MTTTTMDHIIIGDSIKICQINVEGASIAKSEYLSRLAFEHKVDVIAAQELHINNGPDFNTRGLVEGYTVVAYLLSPIYGSATYVRSDIKDVQVRYISNQHDIYCIVVQVAGINITNIYKPPNSPWPDLPIPIEYLRHPALCIGDFNSHHMNWGYNSNDSNGTQLSEWCESLDLYLVFDAKDRPTFHSARWNQGYNPDLCFVSRNGQDRPLESKRAVLSSFPRSQHRPVIVEIGTKIHLTDSKQKPRWNFNKANWNQFSQRVDAAIRFVPCEIKNYDRFIGVIKSAAKRSIPRGFRKRYIPGWTADMEELYKQFEQDNDPEIADELLELLMAAKRAKWLKATSEMSFTHSSRKSWALLRKLGDAAKAPSTKIDIDPNKLASLIQRNSDKCKGNSQVTRDVKSELRSLKSAIQSNHELDRPFSVEDLNATISSIKTGKAAGPDGIYSEFIKHLGKRARLWLLKFINQIFKSSNMPSLLMKTLIIAILKPGKDPVELESYRPIALLSVIYKLLEKLISLRIGHLINEVLPPEFAGFRESRSCSEQTLALTSYIESGFERQMKTSVVFVDLSVAYDTAWRLGFLVKFFRVIPSLKIGMLVNKMLSNRYFRVFISDSSSKVRKLNNGFAQGGVCSPSFFNLYTSDMPDTASRKFPFADDLALAVQTKEFKEAEHVLGEDMSTMASYYEKWRLCLNEEKTECCIFHLNNGMANVELEIPFKNELIRFNKNPKHLGTYLDRPLTYNSNLDKLAQKLKSRNNLLQKLSGTDWGANAEVLRTTALSLVYSTAEFSAPVWYKSAHVQKIDTQLNETMRIITGTVQSTPVPWLHVLSNIAPPHLRRENAAHNLRFKCTEHPNFLNVPIREDLLHPPPPRLISRNPIWQDEIIQDRNYSIKERWKQYWDESPAFENKNIIEDPTNRVLGLALPRKEWKTLNRLRTGHGCCGEKMFLWRFSDSPSCDCDNVTSQSMRHIISDCRLRRFDGGLADIHLTTPEAIDWMKRLDVNL